MKKKKKRIPNSIYDVQKLDFPHKKLRLSSKPRPKAKLRKIGFNPKGQIKFFTDANQNPDSENSALEDHSQGDKSMEDLFYETPTFNQFNSYIH